MAPAFTKLQGCLLTDKEARVLFEAEARLGGLVHTPIEEGVYLHGEAKQPVIHLFDVTEDVEQYRSARTLCRRRNAHEMEQDEHGPIAWPHDANLCVNCWYAMRFKYPELLPIITE